jgi:hypothetical protein
MASRLDRAYTPLVSYNSKYVALQKVKTDKAWDLYVCHGCSRQWKSSDKKIGHTPEVCSRRQLG